MPGVLGRKLIRVQRGRRVRERWYAGGWPTIVAVMEAGERLISVSEQPAMPVRAACDQLGASVRQAQLWLSDHRCPDRQCGLYVTELLSASRGLCAIMEMIATEVPAGGWIDDRGFTDRIGPMLLDRIEQASKAWIYLREHVAESSPLPHSPSTHRNDN